MNDADWLRKGYVVKDGTLVPIDTKETAAIADAVQREIEELHDPIMRWCRSQVPAVPYIRARSDMASTIGEGAPDFTIPYQGRVLFIECKSATGKVKPNQLAWKLMLEAQGLEYHVIRTMREFYALIKAETTVPASE